MKCPSSRIGAGRKLRCARCQHDWWVEPPAAARAAAELSFARAVAQAAPAAPAPAMPVPPDALAPRASPDADDPPAVAAAPPEPRPAPSPPPLAADVEPIAPPRRPGPVTDRSGALVVAWVASAILMLGFAASVFLYRVQILEAWPPAERFYRIIGLGGP